MIVFNVNLSGLMATAGVQAFQADFNKRVIKAVKKGMDDTAPVIRKEVRADAETKLNIKRKVIIKSFVAKVYHMRTDRLPTMHVYSGIPWMGVHDTGKSIGGKILIPLATKRIGWKTWKVLIADLKAAGNLFFEKKNGKTFAWCLNTPAFTKQLQPFKKYQKGITGKGTKKNAKVIIALSRKQIVNKKKINLTEIVRNNMPLLTRNIEQAFV